MALKSDSYGFLVGAPVEWGKALDVWNDILVEIRALRLALAAGHGSAVPSAKRRPPSSTTAVPALVKREVAQAVKEVVAPAKRRGNTNHSSLQRDSSGRFLSKGGGSAQPTATPVSTKVALHLEPPIDLAKAEAARPKAKTDWDLVRRQNAAMAPARPARSVDGQKREENGRFAGAGKKGPTNGDGPLEDGAKDEPADSSGKGGRRKRGEDEAVSLLSRVMGRVRTASGVVASAPEIDPTISALKEVQSIASPVGRGIGKLFSRSSDRAVPWYRRILGELRGMRRDDSSFHKAELRKLKDIEQRTSTGSGSGLLGGMLSKIPGLGIAGRLLGSVGGGLGALLKFGRKSGLLRRIPLLGGLLAGGSALYSMLGFGDDANASPEENRRSRFEGGGAGVGAIAGGALGTFLGGPVGTVIGGIIGEKVGSRVGGWLAEVDWKNVAENITDSWGAVTQLIKTKFGVDVPAVMDAAKEVAKKAIDYGGDFFDKISSATKSAAEWANQEVIQPAANAIKRIVQTGAGFNVVERGDGSVVQQSGARNWRNNNPGNIEYGDFAKKHGAIGSDGRFAIFPDYGSGRKAKESLIFDGKSYRNLTLSQAISRYAPASENDTAAYQRSVLGSVGGQDLKMSDYTPAQRTVILDAMQKVEGYKVGKTVIKGRSGVPVLAAGGVPGTPVVASAPTVSVNTAVPMPKIADAPALSPLTAIPATSRQEIRVTQEKGDVGQNLSDSKIARIATGGLSSP
ncbi:hypothetical protein [Cupriavidus basilensis]|uniref:Uncharacterized protein n=1 Tax=Cupriavidus basilensis TaxID=68895 RepID=A0A0C4Y724_9BURK|nr:hypothetical protein [Cupriavidus basilensis]AJG18835.1 hypothetical protein RR42_m1434 [Cupriavidus basilensis]